MGLLGDPADSISRKGHEAYRTGMGDLPTSLALTAAILSGLHLRERSGRGCEVETSLLRNAGAYTRAVLACAQNHDCQSAV
jgi:crotonobetainyl-CoA:carnitine CoA-transferase CaiB-like acyl-CoA transferase